MLLRGAHHKAHDLFSDALGALQLDVRQFGILIFLSHAPMSQRELQDQVSADKSTMVRLIDDLERQGLVTRTPNPRDRRAYAVAITNEGRLRLRASEEVVESVGHQLFGWLSAADRRRLETTLRQIVVRGLRPD